jgi:hypothetical protein
MWEVEIRIITVPGQTGQKTSLRDIIFMGKSWMWWCVHTVIPTTKVSTNRRIVVQAGLGKKQDPISRKNRKKDWRYGSSRMPA